MNCLGGGFIVSLEGLSVGVMLRKAFLYLVVMSATCRIRSHMFEGVPTLKVVFNVQTWIVLGSSCQSTCSSIYFITMKLTVG